jgi:hypothetical protein
MGCGTSAEAITVRNAGYLHADYDADAETRRTSSSTSLEPAATPGRAGIARLRGPRPTKTSRDASPRCSVASKQSAGAASTTTKSVPSQGANAFIRPRATGDAPRAAGGNKGATDVESKGSDDGETPLELHRFAASGLRRNESSGMLVGEPDDAERSRLWFERTVEAEDSLRLGGVSTDVPPPAPRLCDHRVERAMGRKAKARAAAWADATRSALEEADAADVVGPSSVSVDAMLLRGLPSGAPDTTAQGALCGEAAVPAPKLPSATPPLTPMFLALLADHYTTVDTL